MSASIPRRRLFGWLTDWFACVPPPPLPRTVLAWLWWTFKHLYRGSYFFAALVFISLWLAFIGKEPGAGRIALMFVGSLHTLMFMAASSLGGCCDFIVSHIWRLPHALAIPAFGWLASYVIYGLVRAGRAGEKP